MTDADKKARELAESLLKLVGWLSILFIGLPMHIAWNAVVLVRLWRWFIVPLGVLPLTFWTAVGVDVLFTFIIMAAQPSRKEDEELAEAWKRVLTKLFQTAFLFALGWFAHWMAT